MIEREDSNANNIRQVIIVFGSILTFVLPGIFIPESTHSQYLQEYSIYGIIMGIIIILRGFIALKFDPKERVEFKDEYKNFLSLKDSIRYCIKNKSFMWYIPAEIANWFVYGILTVIVILYAKFVLNVQDTFIQLLMLGIVFISAVIFITVLWKPLVKMIGLRKSWLLSMSIWIITLIPLLFIQDALSGMLVFFFTGISLAGSLFIVDLIISDIIDENEVNSGVRRRNRLLWYKYFFFKTLYNLYIHNYRDSIHL